MEAQHKFIFVSEDLNFSRYFPKPVQKNIFYIYILAYLDKSKSSKDMELIRKNNKKKNKKNEDQSGSGSDSGNENYHTTYRKRRRMRIISESESEIKGVDNEKNIVKAGSCFIIVFKFGSHRCLDYYTKRPLERTKLKRIFSFD